jgi:hypothetical protein
MRSVLLLGLGSVLLYLARRPLADVTQRARFFVGQLLGADDFSQEQDYHRERHRFERA